ncbi:DUF2947 domain-containing protein [Parendozoicomonas sp. Alg238-R29]|uniref:DUF2947 domain-containing protein n=1 Tax=Parendozoicomonas sp. Alg238-R29 TaxID=2993446 RepID=UPI00248F2D35|nr:DUF2947 domain-containing protein [Parendozoicomonas sp. Alg238-R29]
MKYIPLSDYKNTWIFRHAEMPVPAEDLEQIKPLASVAAIDIWRNNISKQCLTPEDFGDDDWPVQEEIWEESGSWQEEWESDSPELPRVVTEHLQWTPETTVFYCIDSEAVLETTWDVFSRHWKNFLFFDDECILIGRKRKQALQFHQDGTVSVGRKGIVAASKN